MTVPARSSGTGPDQAPATDATPNAPVALVAPPTRADLVDRAVERWREGLVEAAGGSTLADMELLGDAALDLTAAHPSGMAQLFAGRPTRLSNLVREGAALSTARRRARAVASRAAVYEQRYGIAPTALAIGVATWTERPAARDDHDDVDALAVATRPADPAPRSTTQARTVRAPVLLRPVTLRARGTGEADYEIALEPTLDVNPVLARALRTRGALLDPGAVARGTFESGGFDPRGALARLSSLGEAVLDDFRLTEKVVVGTFVHPGQILVDDLDALSAALDQHEVVCALAGVDVDRERLVVPLPEPVAGDRDPGVERGVGDLDPAQQHLLDALSTGAHLFVDAPTGADVTGTLAAVVADAAASGRTVLYVPGHRRGATALAARLDELGLGDLLLDVAPEAGWRTAAARRLLGAMTLDAPPVDGQSLHVLRTRLVEHRERLRAYVDDLHATRTPWGASAYDALQQLARLTSTRPAPRTTVRLTPDVARVLDAERRAALGADLVRAGELGAFDVRPVDTPWYGADLRTRADADVVVRRISRLLDGALPALVERTAQVAADTGLTQATSVASWAEQLRMLDGVRGALDVFLPIVFERTAADLVAATATPQWRTERGVDMGFWLRRRLRRQARDMVRPGRPVADLHTALLDVQAQREIWQAHCPAGGWPRLPDGLEHIEEEHQAVAEDLRALDEVLASTPGGAGLAQLPFAALTERLSRLRADTSALDTLPDRTGLLHRLRAAGLGELVDDLATRRVDPALAPAELDLAWWSTVIEQILTQDPTLAGYDGAALGDLSAQYAALDRAHVASLAGPVRQAVAAHTQEVLRQNREQSESLFVELVEERLTSLRDTIARHPDIARRLRPVVAASPMLVPQVLPPSRTVDLVVIDAAAHLPVDMAVAAIARGRQVVVVGDARCASGTAVRELAAVLPVVALHAETSRRDPYLTAFLAAHGYEGVLSPTPLPEHRPLVRLDVVDGTGMPDAATGTVASTRAEVEHVVELVLHHALMQPDESLAVVTPSAVHADALRDAILTEVRGNPAVAAFFDGGRAEPFVVTDLANVAGLRREAVILSVGFGRTPHRRVLHSFGVVGEPGGDALLLDVLGATRHRLTVVSCFGADDLDPERVRAAGPRLLRDLLAFAESRGAGATGDDVRLVAPGPRPDADIDLRAAEAAAETSGGTAGGSASASAGVARGSAHDSGEPDRLLLDLAERLWRHGLTVEVDYGIPGGTRIPMVVGHPDAHDRLLVAVLTDDEAYVGEPSVRVRDRLLADRLERLGWTVVRVWSAAAFLDPQAEVDRIRRAVHGRVPAPAIPRKAPLVLGIPSSVDESDDVEELPPVTAPIRISVRATLAARRAAGADDVDGATADDEPDAGAQGRDRSTGTEGRDRDAGSEGRDRGAGVTGDDPDASDFTRDADGAVAARDMVRSEAGDVTHDSGGAVAAHDMVRSEAGDVTHDSGGAVAAHDTVDTDDPTTDAGRAPIDEAATAGAGMDAASGEASVARVDGESSTVSPPTTGAHHVQLTLAGVPGAPRPDVRKGLPIGAYSDDQLDELVAWLRSDGEDRNREQLAAALRDELGITRRSYRIDTAVRSAVSRALR
ncbi:hypothetical protein [Cellulomonas sp. H30R-01]|uniref:hypothetical protein n=1 Tax=Cellulomonas sp. H30R-01 TaxID=2704467 RepID=UPI001EE48A2E|nr:hypothetical protein [Cellulomonas sp. H30R-01]